MSPLDNPVWSSLSTVHRAVALGDDRLRRYPADVAPFLGTTSKLDAGALRALVRPDETLYLLGPTPEAPPGFRVESLGRLHQMICETRLVEVEGPAVVPLSTEHRPAVLELTALVYPHYFRPRTMDLGRYFGIMIEGRLAAMIGERMGAPGLREISAVCTHPDFTGRRYARRLLAWLSNELLERGQVPFLHVSPGNHRAGQLYRANGYRDRTMIAFSSLRAES